MILEVVSPEATLFSGEVNSVAVPGANGAFQVLDNHAPIVSILKPGTVKIGGKISLPEETAHNFKQQGEETFLELANGGTLEMQQNKIVLLAD
ncbi:MAG: ATP synthase epsilon chain [Flavobacteriaceae bacterium]|nr:MAG: ATP synthase epsilon chain [Flavobacteriaceae bacterium]